MFRSNCAASWGSPSRKGQRVRSSEEDKARCRSWGGQVKQTQVTKYHHGSAAALAAEAGLRIAICSPRGMSRSPRGIQRVRCGLRGTTSGSDRQRKHGRYKRLHESQFTCLEFETHHDQSDGNVRTAAARRAPRWFLVHVPGLRRLLPSCDSSCRSRECLAIGVQVNLGFGFVGACSLHGRGIHRQTTAIHC